MNGLELLLWMNSIDIQPYTSNESKLIFKTVNVVLTVSIIVQCWNRVNIIFPVRMYIWMSLSHRMNGYVNVYHQ